MPSIRTIPLGRQVKSRQRLSLRTTNETTISANITRAVCISSLTVVRANESVSTRLLNLTSTTLTTAHEAKDLGSLTTTLTTKTNHLHLRSTRKNTLLTRLATKTATLKANLKTNTLFNTITTTIQTNGSTLRQRLLFTSLNHLFGTSSRQHANITTATKNVKVLPATATTARTAARSQQGGIPSITGVRVTTVTAMTTNSHPGVEICTNVTGLIVPHLFLTIKRRLVNLTRLFGPNFHLDITKVWIQIVLLNRLTVNFFSFVVQNTLLRTWRLVRVALIYRGRTPLGGAATPLNLCEPDNKHISARG